MPDPAEPSPPPGPAQAPEQEQALIDRLRQSMAETAGHLVPWFRRVMPEAYFAETDEATRMSHLRALVGIHASETPLSLVLQNRDGTVWTYIGEDDHRGLLTELLARAPRDRPLRSADVFTARDSSLVLDMFGFAEPVRFNPADPEQVAAVDRLTEAVRAAGESEAGLAEHLARCAKSYLLTTAPERFATHWRLLSQTVGGEEVRAAVDAVAGGDARAVISVAARSSNHRRLFERLAAHLAALGLDIRQASLELLDESAEEATTLLEVAVATPAGVDPNDPAFQSDLIKQIRRLKWIDGRALRLSYANPVLTLEAAEVWVALCDLVHQKLTRLDPFLYAQQRIAEHAQRHVGFVADLVNLFLARFRSEAPIAEAEFVHLLDLQRKPIPGLADGEDVQTVMQALVDAVGATLRCNVGHPERYALALRLDPAFLFDGHGEIPFGVYFVHGRGFNGFQVRFRDIARGGVRVVTTRSAEHHLLENERLYEEVNGLATAQQLKNKDIPEGGSKAVILLEPNMPAPRSVKAFGDALLDLLIPGGPALEPAVDRLGRPEWLFLGPDENMSDALIVWLVARAAARGYPQPDSFMSSKPETGINHKAYGVTSEGVNVFLDAALRHIGVNGRRDAFTLKMTGGPDGDVGGNELKILHRDFGTNPRVVGIADGSGSAEDPDGLDWPELLRLATENRPIAAFDPARLGPQGRVSPLSDPEGGLRRNTLHNRLRADAFLPCGGRPATVHKDNWRQFLLPDGTPSARVVVEGANLFFTEEARRALSTEAGVIMVKDSSANKAGVICSSFEIAASLMVDNTVFKRIKEQFVAETLDRLRRLAGREARLLFAEYGGDGRQTLPEISVRLSRAINRAADVFQASLNDLDPADRARLQVVVADHLPPILLEAAGPDALSRLPGSYLNAMIASPLAAGIIYHEGLDFLERTPEADLPALAVDYLRLAHRTRELVAGVRASSLPDAEEIAALLERGGTRAALRLERR